MRTALLFIALLAGCSGSHAPARPDADAAPRADLERGDGPALAPDRARPDRGRPDGASTLAAGCTSDLECSSGMSCLLAWPGGFCARPCGGDGDCGLAGAKQAVAACYQGRCHPRCDPRAAFAPCREGYVCRIDGARAICVPDCRLAGGCASGWSCEKGSGLCIDPSSGAVGAACGATLGGCDGTPNGVCYSIGGFAAGFCTIPCSPFTRPCPLELKGSACLLGSLSAPYCGFLCDPKAPACPHPGMSCEAVGEVHVCLP